MNIFRIILLMFGILIGSEIQAGEISSLLFPGDLHYQGAFRLPSTPGDKSRWGYGGHALTYNPGGDRLGANDGYPGSLFGTGHTHHNLVSEVDIPKTVISHSKNAKDLPMARTIQPFADITEGLRKKVGVDKLGGLAYLEKQGNQEAERIYWTIYEYYNAEGKDYLSHGCSSLSLSAPHAKGVWHIGPINNSQFHSMKSADYIFDVYRPWADVNVGGNYLVSGRVREAGAFGSSRGPALMAFGPHKLLDSQLGFGAEIEGVPLLSYTEEVTYPDYKPCDRWSAGAWLTSERGKQSAVIFVGRKSLGENYYGEARTGDCSDAKGYHCGPYESQIIFYDPNQLAKVARKEKYPWDVVPYAVMRLGKYFWKTCDGDLGGAAFDRKRGLLYVVQPGVDDSKSRYESDPLVHVFHIGDLDGNDVMRPPVPVGFQNEK